MKSPLRDTFLYLWIIGCRLTNDLDTESTKATHSGSVQSIGLQSIDLWRTSSKVHKLITRTHKTHMCAHSHTRAHTNRSAYTHTHKLTDHLHPFRDIAEIVHFVCLFVYPLLSSEWPSYATVAKLNAHMNTYGWIDLGLSFHVIVASEEELWIAPALLLQCRPAAVWKL